MGQDLLTSRGRWRTAALASAALVLTALWTVPLSATPTVWLPVAAVALAWLAAALVPGHSDSGRLMTAGAAVMWAFAGIVPFADFWHRAFIVHLLIARGGARRTSVPVRATVVAAYGVSALPGAWAEPLIAAPLAVAVVGASLFARGGPGAAYRIAAAAVSATAFAVPPLLAYAGLGRPAALAIWWAYATALIVVAGLHGAAVRAQLLRGTSGLVVELEALPRDTLEHVLQAGREDVALRGDVDVASAAAQALTDRHARLRTELLRSLDETEASRRLLLAAQTETRSAIARALENGAVADIKRIRSRLQSVLTEEDAASPQRRAAGHLDAALADIAAIQHGLLPPAARGGLRGALSSLSETAVIPVSVDAPEESLDETLVEGLYLICAEAITNAVRHAEATKISIRVTASPERVVADIVDDGVGGARAGDGSGIHGILARAAALGGAAVLHSPAGCGTRVHVELPREVSLRSAIPVARTVLP